MRCRRASLLVVAALTLAAHAGDQTVKDVTLARLSRVAELYRDTALGFACQETITYSQTVDDQIRSLDLDGNRRSMKPGSGGTKTGRIRFAYLFIRDEHGRLRDFRTWKTGTTAKQRGKEVDPADNKVPVFLESAYLWAFVFRADRQQFYQFELLAEETVGDRTAVTIEFLPREPIREGINDWAGYAWVDRETTQILKVEAYTPEDWNRKIRLAADIAMADTRSSHKEAETYNIERIVTDFGFEKNGMRLPSHVEITRTRSSFVAGQMHEVLWETRTLKVTQEYTHHEFFSARSSDEIMRFVDGEGPLAP